jgi:hypothetical protein
MITARIAGYKARYGFVRLGQWRSICTVCGTGFLMRDWAPELYIG